MTKVPTTVKNKALVEKRREQIVLAGIELFSKKGFHGATLRELAEESGLSYGNIYQYVGSKEDIFSLIHDFIANQVMAMLLSSIENITDPIERLRRIVQGEFKVMDQWLMPFCSYIKKATFFLIPTSINYSAKNAST